MNRKQLIHARVSYDNYLWAKINIENLSKYFNEVLTVARETSPETPQEENKLLSDKEHLEKTILTAQDTLHRVNIELLSLREKRDKEEKDTLEKAVGLDGTLKAARVLNNE